MEEIVEECNFIIIVYVVISAKVFYQSPDEDV